jgi:hypothetical protein
MTTMMTTTDNLFLNDLCRRLMEDDVAYSTPSRQDTARDDDNQEESWITEDGFVCLTSLPLADYCNTELKMLSESLGRSRTMECLEVDAVDGLDWNHIVGREDCTLAELIVTVRSQQALGILASALCRNSSLARLDLNYVDASINVSDDAESVEDDHSSSTEALVDMSDVYASINHNLLLEAIKPLSQVTIRGISPQQLPASSKCNTMPCSWQHLTLENCDATHVISSWIRPAIASLQKLNITNCRLTPETIECLSEAYLEYSTHQRQEKQTKKRVHKAPLRALNLSNITWDNEEGNDREGSGNTDSFALPGLSSMAFLASWMDSLSYLLELNLSDNHQLFASNEGSLAMANLCGTVNQSLKRLSLRHCGLRPSDLSLMVSTFCWIEGLDLSENSGLLDNMLPLMSLEHLTELVLENMSENGLDQEPTSRANDFVTSNKARGIETLLKAIHREEERQDLEANKQNGNGRRPLERLNLAGNSLDTRALEAIASLTSLKVLILVGCQMESRSIHSLLEDEHEKARPLPWEELYLQCNNIGDEGAMTLAHNLKNGRMSSLRVLQLESNIFTLKATKSLINDGLVHSRRLVSMGLWPFGAVTSNQQSIWEQIQQTMEHYLLLNQAGREVLFLDRQDGNQSQKNKVIPRSVWPFLLGGADQVYGANALYYFLHKRPDLISFTKKQAATKDCPKAPTPKQSPKSVMDMHCFG